MRNAAYRYEDRHNSNHPLAVEYDNSADKKEALDALRANPLAVGLAAIVRVAKAHDKPLPFPASSENQWAYLSIQTAWIDAEQRLDDLATVAAQTFGLNRDDLPAIGQLVDMLAGEA